MAEEEKEESKNPKAEKPTAEKPKAEKPKAEKPKAEKPKAEAGETKGETAAPAPKRKIKKLVPKAIVNIVSTFNNTIITVAAPNGETLCWSSSGHIGYKGSRKSTPFAAQKAAEAVAHKAQKFGVREVEVKVKGPGAGRESAVRALQNAGLAVRAIVDVTPLPHNGCRPRKKRRV